MKINTRYDDVLIEYVATEDNYCGCSSCQDHIGYGKTEAEAIEDLKEKLENQNYTPHNSMFYAGFMPKNMRKW